MTELKTRGEKGFAIFAEAVIVLLVLLSIAPILLIFIASITQENSLISNGYSFFPKALSLDAYSYLLGDFKTILRAYGISILVTAAGTLLGVLITAMLAYPISRSDFKYGRIIAFLVLFTMLFSGGLRLHILCGQEYSISRTPF